ncbi:hypothetical protein [Bosea sp. 124]|uniref:hypothetical protein n=1 Tax=Bosea sp. 124 TaxID=2135642 RepID=UPI000D380614|nr:hypothetical protein [Bosea sp. 124]PTM40510.1 hypothetical protein C8D03_2034 [Bosea sp. 124]
MAYRPPAPSLAWFCSATLAWKPTAVDTRNGEAQLHAIERRIQKELFTCTNAVVSLVEHARRVSKERPIADYNAQRLSCFGTDGLHEFVVALRVMLHHLHIVDAGWNLQTNVNKDGNTASFMIHKDAVLRIMHENEGSFTPKTAREAARSYIAAKPSTIDLRDVFQEYEARAHRFNNWFKQQLQSEKLADLRDYDRLIKEKVNFDQLTIYKAMMHHWLKWDTPPDPHRHLSRYLSADQLAEAYKLPRNSPEQVDLIIGYADRDNAIDEKLREQVYELFRRSPSPELIEEPLDRAP